MSENINKKTNKQIPQKDRPSDYLGALSDLSQEEEEKMEKAKKELRSNW